MILDVVNLVLHASNIIITRHHDNSCISLKQIIIEKKENTCVSVIVCAFDYKDYNKENMNEFEPFLQDVDVAILFTKCLIVDNARLICTCCLL